ncbi:hypothetical protein GCM10007966_19340 [Legionella impletisoli]|uniref:Uncharacterized protein n=1 Tax=Legionella impletisoli TaxID=343510 RepID=A0A917JX06_9GAMM|nr:hypothetical protein GCM10007966_19340 [Legionella impletisoli]
MIAQQVSVDKVGFYKNHPYKIKPFSLELFYYCFYLVDIYQAKINSGLRSWLFSGFFKFQGRMLNLKAISEQIFYLFF